MRRLLAVVLAAGVLVSLTGAALAAGAYRADVRPAYAKDGLLTILVIGSDIGPPHRAGNPLRGRADGIHLLAIDTQARRLTMVDFPRDSLIGGGKASTILARGGPQRLQAELESYTGIGIDFWILATFRSIENLVDGLGGVDIVIEQRMADRWSGTDLHPGPQRLPGWQALAYVRDRKSFGAGDVQRSRNQGTLMRAAQAQIREHHGGLAQMVRLVGMLARNTVTNIPPRELLELAHLAVAIPPEHIHQVTLSGSLRMTRGGASVIVLAPGNVFQRIADGTVGP